MPITNVLLVRAAYGWDERTRASSIDTYGRREALYGLGANGSPADVARTADTRLDIIATPRYQYDAEHQPLNLTELAYRGYGVGDTLPMTVDAGSVTERVISLAVSEDDVSGQSTVTASLHDVVLYASPLENFVAMLSQAVKKMIPGTGRGDWKEAQPVTPPAVPAPVSAWVPPVSACVTESFDKADSDTLGADQTWLLYDGSTPGDGPIKNWSDQASLTGRGDEGTTLAQDWARAEADCGSADMEVSATVSGLGVTPSIGGHGFEFGVLARCIEFPGDVGAGYDPDPTSWTIGNGICWRFEVVEDGGDWFPWLDFAYYDATFQNFSGIQFAASFQSAGFGAGSPLASPIVEGDKLSLRVTGIGDQTRVVCKINDVAILDVQGNDLAQMGFYPGSGDPTGQYDLWGQTLNCTGQRGGIFLRYNPSDGFPAGDNAVRMDDFSACPV